MAAREGAQGVTARPLAARQQLARRSPGKLWLSVALSAALHVTPVVLPLPQLATQLLPLRPSAVELQVLHQVVLQEQPEEVPGPAEEAPAPEASREEAAAVPVPTRKVAAPAPPAPTPVPAAAVEPKESPAEPAGVIEEPSVAEAAPVAAAITPVAVSSSNGASPGNASMGIASTGSVSSGGGAASTGLRSGGSSAVAGSALGTSGVTLAALRGRYLGQLRDRVLARREYPRLARRAGLEGTVCLRAAVDASGRLTQVQATCAAPAPLLEAALRALREAAPFAPLPAALGQQLVFDLPIVFQLDAG